MPADIEKLRQLIARLRSPDGCPWDREQTLDSVRAYLIEETHEAAAAIDGGDRQELRDELGDLLFQAVFVARLAEEEKAFDLGDAIDTVHDKMIARHPHVFGPAAGEGAVSEPLTDAAAAHRAWERRKLESRGDEPRRSVLAGVPSSLPALTGAHRMTQKAAGVGFDWPEIGGVMAKIREELAEVDEVIATDEPERQKEEIGDLLFAVVNLARHLKIDPEAALSGANRKFRRRFEALEEVFVDRDRSLPDATLEELDAVWDEIKDQEPKP
ncbi:MAG: nucleoside triphosphate pyrophosphohydrolase [Acidobacteriota bacterium]